MNAERLLAHYERIADAPDAIERLRQFVLDLAVRGKLVPQDAADEPAHRLLERIRSEKTAVSGGRLLRDESSGVTGSGPFKVPNGWVWTALGEIAIKLTDGTHHSPPNSPTGDFMYITAKNIKEDGLFLESVTFVSREIHNEIYSRCNPEKGDVLYVKDGATTGVVTINDLDEPFSMLSSVALLKLPKGVLNYLIVLFLRSPFFYDQMRGFMKGAAIPRVTLKRMAPARIPLPPVSEQHRIVAKVDELMALCDRLEVARKERETTRGRLTVSSLARLNSPHPETFRDDARFVLNALPAFSARGDQIKKIRQTILNLAVRGKLVPQYSNEEPASATLTQMNAPHWANEQPREATFPAPIGWAWVRLHVLFEVITDGDHQPPPRSESGIAFLTIGNVTSGTLAFDDCRFVPIGYYESIRAERRPTRGDILYTVVGATYGRPIPVETDRPFCVQRHIAILRPRIEVDRAFLLHLLKSTLVYDQASASKTGTAQPTVPLGRLRQFLVPVPPVSEQRRIVAKVGELMTLCGRLEASLIEADASRGRLLEALLAEALGEAA